MLLVNLVYFCQHMLCCTLYSVRWIIAQKNDAVTMMGFAPSILCTVCSPTAAIDGPQASCIVHPTSVSNGAGASGQCVILK